VLQCVINLTFSFEIVVRVIDCIVDNAQGECRASVKDQCIPLFSLQTTRNCFVFGNFLWVRWQCEGGECAAAIEICVFVHVMLGKGSDTTRSVALAVMQQNRQFTIWIEQIGDRVPAHAYAL
jgi:hypothetical protein